MASTSLPLPKGVCPKKRTTASHTHSFSPDSSNASSAHDVHGGRSGFPRRTVHHENGTVVVIIAGGRRVCRGGGVWHADFDPVELEIFVLRLWRKLQTSSSMMPSSAARGRPVTHTPSSFIIFFEICRKIRQNYRCEESTTKLPRSVESPASLAAAEDDVDEGTVKPDTLKRGSSRCERKFHPSIPVRRGDGDDGDAFVVLSVAVAVVVAHIFVDRGLGRGFSGLSLRICRTSRSACRRKGRINSLHDLPVQSL